MHCLFCFVIIIFDVKIKSRTGRVNGVGPWYEILAQSLKILHGQVLHT